MHVSKFPPPYHYVRAACSTSGLSFLLFRRDGPPFLFGWALLLSASSTQGAVRALHHDTFFKRFTCAAAPGPGERTLAALGQMLATNKAIHALEIPAFPAPREVCTLPTLTVPLDLPCSSRLPLPPSPPSV